MTVQLPSIHQHLCVWQPQQQKEVSAMDAMFTQEAVKTSMEPVAGSFTAYVVWQHSGELQCWQ